MTGRETGSLIRLVVEFLICVILALTVVTTWLVEPFIVPSGSMATTLLGPHRQVSCPHCQYTSEVGADLDSIPEFVRCPNCQRRVGPEHQTPVARGDRLLVLKNIFRFRRPERWEVAVFRRPAKASQTYVKRIVGLPGERVSIRHGEVYINGHLQRKSLPQQRVLGILVHDNSHLAAQSAWQPESNTSKWKGNRDWECTALDGPPEAKDWLVFRQQTPSIYDASEMVEQAALDVHYYNQTRSGRVVESLRKVADLRVACEIHRSGAGLMECKASDGREEFYIRLNFGQEVGELFYQGVLIQTKSIPSQSELRFEVSLVDRQLLCVVDDNLIFEPWPMQFATPPEQISTRPFAFAVENTQVKLSNLKVWRDVYYTQPPNKQPQGPNSLLNWESPVEYQLAENEYFVLGDNTAYSEDSRYWEEGPGVPHRLLVGKPYLVHLPSGWLRWGSRWFQVPAWRRIRYIR